MITIDRQKMRKKPTPVVTVCTCTRHASSRINSLTLFRRLIRPIRFFFHKISINVHVGGTHCLPFYLKQTCALLLSFSRRIYLGQSERFFQQRSYQYQQNILRL